MSQIAYTMPEAKFRSTKKQKPSFRNSEFPYEFRSFQAMSAKAVSAKAVQVSQPSVEMAAIKSAAAAPADDPAKLRSNKKDKGASWASWWPVAVGLFLTGFAPEWWTMANQAGIWGMRVAFPLALLATHKEIGLNGPIADMLPHAALYLQIPLEGLLTKLTLDRGKSLLSAAVQLILVHFVATLVLYLLSMGGN